MKNEIKMFESEPDTIESAFMTDARLEEVEFSKIYVLDQYQH